MQMLIRKAQLTDYDEVKALFTEELAYHIELLPDLFQMPESVMTVDWYTDELKNEATVMLIAEIDCQVAGLVQVMIRNNPRDPIFRKRRYAHIEDIVVARKYQGNGIGRHLMETAQKWARDQGASAVELWVWKENNEAIQFYEHLGYTNVRQSMQLHLE